MPTVLSIQELRTGQVWKCRYGTILEIMGFVYVQGVTHVVIDVLADGQRRQSRDKYIPAGTFCEITEALLYKGVQVEPGQVYRQRDDHKQAAYVQAKTDTPTDAYPTKIRFRMLIKNQHGVDCFKHDMDDGKDVPEHEFRRMFVVGDSDSIAKPAKPPESRPVVGLVVDKRTDAEKIREASHLIERATWMLDKSLGDIRAVVGEYLPKDEVAAKPKPEPFNENPLTFQIGTLLKDSFENASKSHRRISPGQVWDHVDHVDGESVEVVGIAKDGSIYLDYLLTEDERKIGGGEKLPERLERRDTISVKDFREAYHTLRREGVPIKLNRTYWQRIGSDAGANVVNIDETSGERVIRFKQCLVSGNTCVFGDHDNLVSMKEHEFRRRYDVMPGPELS